MAGCDWQADILEKCKSVGDAIYIAMHPKSIKDAGRIKRQYLRMRIFKATIQDSIPNVFVWQ
jgi:hypothetical protein